MKMQNFVQNIMFVMCVGMLAVSCEPNHKTTREVKETKEVQTDTAGRPTEVRTETTETRDNNR